MDFMQELMSLTLQLVQRLARCCSSTAHGGLLPLLGESSHLILQRVDLLLLGIDLLVSPGKSVRNSSARLLLLLGLGSKVCLRHFAGAVGAGVGPVVLLSTLLQAGRSSWNHDLLVSLVSSLRSAVRRVHNLNSSPEHPVPAGRVLLLVVVSDVHDVPARAWPSIPLCQGAVTRKNLCWGHPLVRTLGLTELDHEHWAGARSSP
mmetsp:Transcript_8629/g.19559  ORF Transcript_8629/g.19559 Transcript_8629/m.19559 type:complete len:204 (-) Transcript_8629:667-1278(-)